MPISATMSLWGLYQYDSTILDGLTVPTGMDSDNLKQNLLIETASLEILYPDPNFLKTAILLWSTERKDVWDKLYETTQLQYDPIENYDRMEESEEQNTGISTSESSGTTSNSGTQSKSTSQSDSGSQSKSNTQTDNTEQNRSTSQADSGSRSGTNTATNSATAYNSNTFADTAKTITSGSDDSSSNSVGTEDISSSGSSNGSEDISSSNISNGTENSSTSGSENSSTRGSASETGNRIFKSRIHGNIGVKTAMAMIQEQRDIVQFCMQEYIINDFVQRFCIMVY